MYGRVTPSYNKEYYGIEHNTKGQNNIPHNTTIHAHTFGDNNIEKRIEQEAKTS